MNSHVETKVKEYLRRRMHYTPLEAANILYLMREAARMVGRGLDDDFAGIGLGTGPVGKLASEVLGRALCRGAYTTGEGALRKHLDLLLMKHKMIHATQM
ncbi:MAG: hypothetical protein JXQ75_21010 [Phycisphaerae bacterium]|nr:hypothetical protein [Phycisphaerae bacterium]